MKRIHFRSNAVVLLTAFLTPALLMMLYFVYRKMEPFGTNTLLTVDLGQQYIDFFSYMRRAVLQDPSSIFYSFSNALGGETLGIWAYYLLSPWNLVLLFFKGTSLPTGILLLTVVKYGLAGLSMSWLLLKTKRQNGLRNITLSTSYALMGWMIANQFNVMWLDAVYLLPLVFYGLYVLMTTGKWNVYLVWLFVSLIINFYMAYMICIFMITSFIWFSADTFKNWKSFGKQFRMFALTSITSGFLAAFLLLPTWWSLSQSKAQYTLTTFKWQFEFFPPKMIAKLFDGAFNFSQIPVGTANIFVGSIATVGVILFFCDHRISVVKRIVAGAITAFLTLSICFQPLDILWHAGQFPIWYPYRFSFVIAFWFIWLASQTLNTEFKPRLQDLGITVLVLSIGISYVYFNLSKFTFLNKTQMFISIVYVALAVILMVIPCRHVWAYSLLFFIIGVSDVMTNAVQSLNTMTYLTQSDYGFYTKRLESLVSNVQKNDSSTYRIGKNFLRTKGDALQVGFNGGGVFSSVLSKQTADFYGKIGSPDSSGSVEYSNGTLVTDALLGMKYYLKETPNYGLIKTKDKSSVSSNKADTAYYQSLGETNGITTYKNRFALPIGYVSDKEVLNFTNRAKLNPARYQANWLSALTGSSKSKNIYEAQKFDSVKFQNIYPVKSLKSGILKKKDSKKPGILILKFTPKTNDSYYYSFGPSMSSQGATYSLNSLNLNQYGIYRNTVMVSVASYAMNQPQTLAIELKGKTFKLQDFSLLRLKTNLLLSNLAQLKSQPWKLEEQTNRYFRGNVTSRRKQQVLNTSIPYSPGWRAKVNGRRAKVYKTMDMFSAVKLPKGKNEVTFSYWPPLFNLGLIISGITLLLLFVFTRVKIIKFW